MAHALLSRGTQNTDIKISIDAAPIPYVVVILGVQKYKEYKFGGGQNDNNTHGSNTSKIILKESLLPGKRFKRVKMTNDPNRRLVGEIHQKNSYFFRENFYLDRGRNRGRNFEQKNSSNFHAFCPLVRDLGHWSFHWYFESKMTVSRPSRKPMTQMAY